MIRKIHISLMKKIEQRVGIGAGKGVGCSCKMSGKKSLPRRLCWKKDGEEVTEKVM